MNGTWLVQSRLSSYDSPHLSELLIDSLSGRWQGRSGCFCKAWWSRIMIITTSYKERCPANHLDKSRYAVLVDLRGGRKLLEPRNTLGPWAATINMALALSRSPQPGLPAQTALPSVLPIAILWARMATAPKRTMQKVYLRCSRILWSVFLSDSVSGKGSMARDPLFGKATRFDAAALL